jgi:hypothetical protein
MEKNKIVDPDSLESASGSGLFGEFGSKLGFWRPKVIKKTERKNFYFLINTGTGICNTYISSEAAGQAYNPLERTSLRDCLARWIWL